MKIQWFFLIITVLFLIVSCQPSSSDNVSEDIPDNPALPIDNAEAENTSNPTTTPNEEDEAETKTNYFQSTLDVTAIDKEQTACIENNETTAGMISCTGSAHEAWDAALNKYYKLAVGSMEGEESSAIKKAQIEWIKYKEAENKLIREVTNDFPGTLFSVTSVSDQLYVTKIRTLEIILKSFGHGEAEPNEKLSNYVQRELKNYFGEDKFYSECEAKDRSNLGMRQCGFKSAKHHDKILNEYYKKLMDLIDNEEKEQILRQTQRNWIKYMEAELEIYDAIYKDMGGGSMYPTMRAQRYAAVVRQRAIELENYYNFMKVNME